MKSRDIGVLTQCERLALLAVSEKFDLLKYPDIYPEEVKLADDVILATEAVELVNNYDNDWGLPPPVDMGIDPWSPKVAKFNFLAKFMDITGMTPVRKTETYPPEFHIQECLDFFNSKEGIPEELLKEMQKGLAIIRKHSL